MCYVFSNVCIHSKSKVKIKSNFYPVTSKLARRPEQISNAKTLGFHKIKAVYFPSKESISVSIIVIPSVSDRFIPARFLEVT